ncbi:MAG: metal-binding protein [Candidatus Bipolaricaulota bacterium]|nr:metal-binding protein [Candidatus Bipolaricaulota bacterium]
MPSGRTHLRIEMFVFVACVASGVYLFQVGLVRSVYIGVFLGSYLFSSLFLSPDLDLKGSDSFRRWGVARVMWVPYARLFRHRALSHHIILGPLTRIAYLGAIVSLVLIAVLHLTGWQVRFSVPQWPMIAALLCGLYLPNQIHTVADTVWSALHRY